MTDASDLQPVEHPKSAPADRDTAGPLDESEANAVRPYVDLGGVKILPRTDLALRLEVEESTKRVVAVGLDYAGSSLQVQPFAAPRSSGLWHEIREQIVDQISKQGGRISTRDGVFGPELIAEIPVAGGQPRLARFIGVDGPRWFLRGVISGQGVADPAAAEQIEEIYRSIVVVRGTTPMPPRDLIPLHMPAAGQGALAVECRIDDAATRAILAHIDDPDTRTAVTAERAVLARLEAGCTAPIGVLAEIVDDVDALAVFVRAFVGSADDSVELRRSHTGPAANAQEVGRRFADLLLAELPPGTTGEPPDPGGEHAAYAPRPDLPENDRPQTDRPEKETAQ